jgi:hypothetical protein
MYGKIPLSLSRQRGNIAVTCYLRQSKACGVLSALGKRFQRMRLETHHLQQLFPIYVYHTFYHSSYGRELVGYSVYKK